MLPAPRRRLFFSYSYKDEALADALRTYLAALVRARVIDEWQDRRVVVGRVQEDEISEGLETAVIILLLVSPDLLASDYVKGA